MILALDNILDNILEYPVIKKILDKDSTYQDIKAKIKTISDADPSLNGGEGFTGFTFFDNSIQEGADGGTDDNTYVEDDTIDASMETTDLSKVEDTMNELHPEWAPPKSSGGWDQAKCYIDDMMNNIEWQVYIDAFQTKYVKDDKNIIAKALYDTEQQNQNSKDYIGNDDKMKLQKLNKEHFKELPLKSKIKNINDIPIEIQEVLEKIWTGSVTTTGSASRTNFCPPPREPEPLSELIKDKTAIEMMYIENIIRSIDPYNKGKQEKYNNFLTLASEKANEANEIMTGTDDVSSKVRLKHIVDVAFWNNMVDATDSLSAEVLAKSCQSFEKDCNIYLQKEGIFSTTKWVPAKDHVTGEIIYINPDGKNTDGGDTSNSRNVGSSSGIEGESFNLKNMPVLVPMENETGTHYIPFISDADKEVFKERRQKNENKPYLFDSACAGGCVDLLGQHRFNYNPLKRISTSGGTTKFNKCIEKCRGCKTADAFNKIIEILLIIGGAVLSLWTGGASMAGALGVTSAMTAVTATTSQILILLAATIATGVVNGIGQAKGLQVKGRFGDCQGWRSSAADLVHLKHSKEQLYPLNKWVFLYI